MPSAPALPDAARQVPAGGAEGARGGRRRTAPISLIWDANTEKPTSAGYLVLRGEAPEGPLAADHAAAHRRDVTIATRR